MATAKKWIFLVIFINYLCTVISEKILGEEVNDEFDFDGLPGVHHEFKVEVGAGQEECFHQKIAKGANVHISYEVMRGGDKTIDFVFKNSLGSVLKDIPYKSDGQIEDITTEEDIYQMCFDNTFSRFSSKLVHMFFVVFVMDDWKAYVSEVKEIDLTVTNFTETLSGVQLSVVEVIKHQSQSRLVVLRDWYLIMGNNRYVQMWSIIQIVLILGCASFQVYFVRRLFRTTNVTPTSKPRA